MAYLPRGISADLLLSQVKNTIPYIFDSKEEGISWEHFPPAKVLRDYDQAPSRPLTHFEYFRLCLCSHYLSCSTPVPTDVDNQIRLKLWPKALDLQIALEMAELVLESRNWDFRKVTTRFVTGAISSEWEKEVLTGHLGEWFTVSAAAYGALGRYSSSTAQAKRQEIFEAITRNVQQHSEIFGSLWRSKQGLDCLKSSALIAHNFGDLDRVMDMWDLPVHDPLRLSFYKLTSSPFDSNRNLRYLGRLWVAGELYKSTIDGSSMAFENHRHFALRKPKCLRQNFDFLIPIGPFFDDWGRRVALCMKEEDLAFSGNRMEVFAALKHGWERLPRTMGYGRALRGLIEVCPELGSEDFCQNPRFRSILETPQFEFEHKWNEQALLLMDEIPSRAE